MKHFAPLLFASLFAFAGCDQLLDNDMERLEEINDQYNRDESEAALKEAKKYVKDFPDSCEGWCLMGWIYLDFDKYDKAEECFDKCLEIDENWDNAYVGKGSMYRGMGENQKARSAYRKAIDILPDNAEAYASLLVIELMEGNDQKAVECGEKAWAISTDQPVVPANLSVAYHYLGDQQKRDYFYDQAARLGYHNLDRLQQIYSGELTIRDE